MSQTLQRVQELMARGEIRISEHGYDELAADDIAIEDALRGVAEADVVEDYPEYFKPSSWVCSTDRCLLHKSSAHLSRRAGP